MKADLDQEISVVNAQTENITNLRWKLNVQSLFMTSLRIISSNKILIIILLKTRLCLLKRLIMLTILKSEIKTKAGNQDLEENIKVAEELVETINMRTEIEGIEDENEVKRNEQAVKA